MLYFIRTYHFASSFILSIVLVLPNSAAQRLQHITAQLPVRKRKIQWSLLKKNVVLLIFPKAKFQIYVTFRKNSSFKQHSKLTRKTASSTFDDLPSKRPHFSKTFTKIVPAHATCPNPHRICDKLRQLIIPTDDKTKEKPVAS